MTESQPEREMPEPDPEPTVIRHAPGHTPRPTTAVTTESKLESADDGAPTIISRHPPAVGRAEDILGGNVRGRRLAHFELLEPVGVGGMAAVLRALDTHLDRIVALKILPPGMAADSENVRRFQQEARAAARLDHENVARVFFCGEDQGLHFIAFEFVEGENLRVILDRRGAIPVAEAVHYMLQLATGLAHAAGRGVVHRDIKPSNILITPNGRAKLVDMGLARSLDPRTDGGLTQSGVTLGTFDYISPEQALEPRDADVRSDIYSLGCTFYHMLTGHPPVPEGTAARKLHHHQHVLPVDPRHLNPAVTDDVAAVLDRMLAKDPKARYQRAEHLVQHLMQVANKLGGAPEGSGGLFVDAALPSPPRARPVLVGAAAVGLLVGLVVLLGGPASVDSSAPPPTPVQSAPEPLASKTPTAPERVDRPLVTPNVDPIPGPQWQRVRTVRELVEALRQTSVHVSLAPGRYDLTRDLGAAAVAGLTFQGKDLEIRAEDPEDRPMLRLAYKPMGDPSSLWAALTVTGGQVRLTGLRFSLDAAGTETPMAAVVHREGGSLQLDQCEFLQAGAADDSNHRHLSAVVVADAVGNRPEVALNGCFLAGGEQGVVVSTPANVQLVNCACGPYAALVRVAAAKDADVDVGLRHCSALLGNTSTAFLFEDGAGGRVVASHCIFSAPAAASAADDEAAVLVRQLGDAARAVRFESQYPNAYHGLTAYWVRGGRIIADTLERFKTEAEINGPEIALAASPWQADRPLTQLGVDPARAFLVHVKLSQLRQPDNPTAHVLGVEECVWGRLYKEKLPPIEDRRPEALARKTKIVDPSAKESGLGVYPGLAQAVADAQSGDVILLRFNGEQMVDPVRLERANVDLTIRPHPGFTPVLLPGPAADPDAAIFRLHDGRLVLEDLQFRIRSKRNDYKSLSAVLLAGDGQVAFKHCVATLEENKEVPVFLVSLADPAAAMKTDPSVVRTGVPQIRLESCFVRGDGDLVGAHPSRPFNLEVEDALVVIDGSLVVVEANPREPAARPAVQVSLRQTTAYLTESLFLLHGCRDEAKQVGLTPTQMTQATGCLFASARGNHALVQLDGVDTDEQMKRFFTWGEGKQNVYSNFASLLDQRPRGETSMPLPPYDQEKWTTFTPRETDRQFAKVKFAGWPMGERPLTRALPEQFKLRDAESPRCGAPIEKLPKPVGETVSPEAPAPEKP